MLNELMIKNAKTQDKSYKLSDTGGLVLLVHKNGTKYWRLRYRFGGKEKMIAFGSYPEVSLKEARNKRDAARVDIGAGIDPSFKRKTEKVKSLISASNSFESIAREWHENQKARWVTKHASIILRRLENNAFPLLGARPISQITAPEVLLALREIESREALETAKRTMQTCGQIFRYAVSTGRAERDVTGDLKGALKSYRPGNHNRLEAKELPEFLSKLEAYEGSIYTKLALKLIVHTFVRTSELRGAKWEEIDFDKAEWVIPAERMKMKEKHIVPLSKQALAILEELKEFKSSGFIFPSAITPLKCMSENTMIFAMYRLGYHSKATVHGFRATASTILNENKFRGDVIERQLAHAERNKIRGAYNHAEYMDERREMMQWWSDYLC